MKHFTASKFTSKLSVLLMTASFGVGTAAQAQTQDIPEQARTSIDAFTDEIVVTATKKTGGENVQDTALSIVAFGESQLDALKLQDITSLSGRIPNVVLADIGTTKGVANFSIRGLGINSSIPSIDPTVGTLIDGVYLGTNFGVIFDTFDLQSVEALRGPQGVLFGRNVTGGAILLNTADPTDELTVKAKLSAESGLRGTGTNFTAQGVISGPIIEDVLSGKIGIYHNNDNGWFENILPTGGTENFGLSDTTVFRGALKFSPSENVALIAKYEHGDQEGQGPAAQSHFNGLPGTLPGQIVNFERDSFDFSIDNPGFSDADWDQFTAKLDVNVGNGSFTNIFGYRAFNQFSGADIDATPANLFHSNGDTIQEQFSNELRYNGTILDGRGDFTAGFYYFEQDLAYGESRQLLGGALFQNGGGILDQRTIGLFSNIDYDITDRLSFNAGIRWTDEEKDAQVATLALNQSGPATPPNFLPCFVIGGGEVEARSGGRSCNFDFVDNFSTSNFSPKIGFGYELKDNARLYGHWARAFRAGGFNFRNTSPDPLALPGPFEDERIDSFEIGFKSEPYAGARFNGAVFLNKIDNLQREINIPAQTAGIVQLIRNTADAEIFGFELDATLPVSDGLLLTGGIGYLDGDYTEVFEDLNNDGVINDTDFDLDLPRLSPFSASVGFIYSNDIAVLGLFTATANYSHADASPFSDNNLGLFNTSDRIDANLSLEIMDGLATISVYGKNLTNDVQFGADGILPPTLGPVPLGGTFSPLQKGRVFGAELILKY